MEMKGKRPRQGEKGKQNDRFAVIHIYGQTKKKKDRQADKEKERQTGRQRDRKTYKQKKRKKDI